MLRESEIRIELWKLYYYLLQMRWIEGMELMEYNPSLHWIDVGLETASLFAMEICLNLKTSGLVWIFNDLYC